MSCRVSRDDNVVELRSIEEEKPPVDVRTPAFEPSRDHVVADDRAARGDDRSPIVRLEGLWDPYRDREFVCFLCDAAVSFPPHCSILGDLADADKCVAIPLCSDCGELPRMLKLRRVRDMLRTMYQARTGKDIDFRPRWH